MRWRCGLSYPDLMHQRNEIKLAMSHTYTHIQLWYLEGHLCLCSLKCWKIATLTCNLCSEKLTPHLRASPQRVGWVHAWRASGSVRNQVRSASVCWEKLMCPSIVFCLLLIFPIYMMKKRIICTAIWRQTAPLTGNIFNYENYAALTVCSSLIWYQIELSCYRTSEKAV